MLDLWSSSSCGACFECNSKHVSFCLRFLLTSASSCRGLPKLAPLPTAHEVPVQQLVFHCDFDLPSDHRLIRELTTERDEVYHELGLPWSDEPIQVYLFGDADAYAQYLARQFPGVPSRRAFFVESDTELAVYAHWSDRVAEDLRHEVAHGYLHAAVSNLPLWLDEGLAEYFEVPRGNGGLNGPHLQLLRDMMEHDGWQPDIARLEQLYVRRANAAGRLRPGLELGVLPAPRRSPKIARC